VTGQPADGRLLVVDWDYFYPVPPSCTPAFGWFDWAHAESPLFIQPTLWYGRAADFVARGLPLPSVNLDWEEWWCRFDIAPDAPLFVAESNCAAVSDEIGPVSEVWLFDAHHDCGYNKAKATKAVTTGTYSCEDWMLYYGYQLGPRALHVRYPLHRPNAFKEEPKPALPGVDRRFYDEREPTPRFDRMFICHSGAWVPPWCDQQFDQFVSRAGRPAQHLPPAIEREWDQQQLDTYVSAFQQVLNGL